MYLWAQPPYLCVELPREFNPTLRDKKWQEEQKAGRDRSGPGSTGSRDSIFYSSCSSSFFH